MTGAQPTALQIDQFDARMHTTRGLAALIIGSAVLIAAIWLLSWQLSDVLARTHVQQKMQDVAAKAEGVLREPGALFSGSAIVLSPRARQALADLARFRDIYRMELRDDRGAIVWRNVPSVSHVKRRWPQDGGVIIEQRNVDGLVRSMARFHKRIAAAGGKTLHLALELDATPQLAAYHRVALLVAKAISTVVLAAILLMGWMLMRRVREQEELVRLMRQLAERVPAAASETDETEGLRREIEKLSARNAAMLRRMARLVQDTARLPGHGLPQAGARRANGGEA